MSKRTRLAAWLLSVAGVGWAHAASESPANPLIVIKAAHLFDSVSGNLTEHGVIVVESGKIKALGSEAQIPPGAQIIDLGDATLLPGFIDAHVHLSAESGPNWYLDFYQDIMRFPAEQALYGAHYAKVTLRTRTPRSASPRPARYSAYAMVRMNAEQPCGIRSSMERTSSSSCLPAASYPFRIRWTIHN
jgi:hypothetical protein